MKLPTLIPLRPLVLATGVLIAYPAPADTVINLGSVTQVSAVSDLDLAGLITHAINFSANDPPLTIGGVTFTPDTSPPVGTSFVGPNNVTPWQTKPEFGDTADDDTLEQILEDIRWANTGASQVLEAHIPVTSGQSYKLQILFYGNHAEDRRWDIEVEGAVAVDEVTSLGANVDGVNPDYLPNAGVLYQAMLTAADSSLDVRFVGDLPETNNDGGSDRNPIWQALTVERVVADSDNDNIADAWETQYFGNLSRNGTGDFDTDGLIDSQEFIQDTKPDTADTDGDTLSDGVEVNTHATNPKLADSDGDSLNDPAEVNTHQTNPNRADTDSDGLNDAAEINTHLTDPKKADSDSDEYEDGFEMAKGSNPVSATSFPFLATQAKGFTGGDKGEGLDLDGTFLYAINVGTNGAPGQARDANFTDDATAGVTVTAVNEIGSWNIPSYGDTANDDVVEQVIQSIRWTGAPGSVDATLTGLTVNRPYKLQLLFGEQCCDRGFDILVNGAQVWDDFSPRTFQGGINNPARGAVLVHEFITTSTDLSIVLIGTGVTDPTLTDHNPTLSGITLETLPPLADADADGLPDSWETLHFGNITAQNGTGDPDADGLNNQREFDEGSKPNDSDSDDDTLNDGAEVLTHHTNPNSADSDGDTLTDAAELNTHLTNPTKWDSDGDCVGDGEEKTRFQTNPLDRDSDDDGVEDGYESLVSATDPNDAGSKPTEVKNGLVCGGDEGEGLDLKGTFVYAFNVGPNGAAGQIQDADFTDDAAPGITVTAVNAIPDFSNYTFGTSVNDTRLKKVMDSIRWEPSGSVLVDLTGIVPGARYKLQLLFGEGCCAARGEDVIVEGTTVVHNLITGPAQGGAGNGRRGSVVTYEFTAPDDVLNISCDGPAADDPTITDHNAILSGVTLERLSAAGAFLITQVTKTGTNVNLTFSGQPSKAYAIDFSADLKAWSEVTDNTTTNASGIGNFTDSLPSRTGGVIGHYRVRDPVVKPTP